MSQKVLIIGAGDVGGFIAQNQQLFTINIEVIGFLDDDKNKIGKEFYGIEVLGPISSIKKYGKDIGIVIGINTPSVKRKILKSFHSLQLNYPSLISGNSWISKGVDIDEGCIIYPGCSINHGTKIGKHVTINMNCAIGHDSMIGSYSSFAPGVNLAGFTKVEEAVKIGIGAATKQKVRIGSNAIIGGQAMVTEDVPPNCTAVGVPAKPIKFHEE